MSNHDGKNPREYDWQRAREQLARVEASICDDPALSLDDARRVMEERARVLACGSKRETNGADVVEIVAFALGDGHYAIETCHVREVAPLPPLTQIPSAPSHLAGIANMRGEIVPVFDLRAFLGIASVASGAPQHLLVLGVDRTEFGIVVDSATDMTALHEDDLLAPPTSAGGADGLIRGVTRDALAVLDGQRLCGDARLYIDRDQ